MEQEFLISKSTTHSRLKVENDFTIIIGLIFAYWTQASRVTLLFLHPKFELKIWKISNFSLKWLSQSIRPAYFSRHRVTPCFLWSRSLILRGSFFSVGLCFINIRPQSHVRGLNSPTQGYLQCLLLFSIIDWLNILSGANQILILKRVCSHPPTNMD